MNRPVIYFLETVDPAGLEAISGDEYQAILPSQVTPCTRVRALITRGKGQVDRALIDRCPDLRVVGRCGVGVNNIDVDYCTERGIQVLNVPGVNAATVAEHTIGLMLMLVRGMYRLVREVKHDNWAYRDTYAGKELRALRLGIVGMGDIGTRVGALAGALEMRVSGAGRERAAREVLLRESDVVSLHVPLTEATRGMIDAAALAQMKPGAYLINTARGELVEAAALLASLEVGQLAGYAGDLAPVGEKKLVQQILLRPDVLVTPHTASLTALTYREMSVLTVSNVVTYLNGKKIAAHYRVNAVS